MVLIRLAAILVFVSMATIFKANIAFASFTSTYASSVSGVTIPNAHVVSQHPGSLVIRGRTPTSEGIDQLLAKGVSRVLIFKKPSGGEVTKEIAELKRKGIRNQDILHLEMPWKDITDFRSTCEMTLQSLRFLEESVKTRKSVFFHCTAGEDRTGYLAALWGLWNGTFRDVNKAIQEEMCNRGYESGNANKPDFVSQAVRESLSPAFVKMVKLLSDARLRGQNLAQIKCPRDIEIQTKIPACR